MSDGDEIREIQQEEQRRGKRPIDLAAQKRRLILLKKFREALQTNNVEKFKEALTRDLGQQPGTPEFEKSMKIWDDFRGTSSRR